MVDNVWSELHKSYQATDWIDKPSLFAETAITYFPASGRVLELGAGQGQDSRFFAEHGHEVVSTDIEASALEQSKAKLTDKHKVGFEVVDLRQELPYESETFDVVYAHLSLHYFDHETTVRLFDQIMHVLKPGGVFAFFVNSINDPEYGNGEQIETDYFQIDKTAKRYFSVASARKYAQWFEITLLDDHGETYKDAAKGVHNLIRFIGTKPREITYGSAIPFCAVIIERDNAGQKEVLVQTRWKPGSDPLYSGTLEFPAGLLDKPFEDIYDTLAREIKEETGLRLRAVKGEHPTKPLTSGRGDSVIGFRPYCCTQQLENGRPWVGFIFICEVEPGEIVSQPSEAKDGTWLPLSDIRKLYEQSPEKLFALELPAWRYYFADHQS